MSSKSYEESGHNQIEIANHLMLMVCFISYQSGIGYQKDIICCLKEIGAHAQNVHSRVNSGHNWGNLFDHVVSMRSSP